MSDVCCTTLYDDFVSANTFKGILASFNQICADLQLDPLDYQGFYQRLRTRLNSWKAEKLWTLLDERAAQKEYRKQRACQNLKVLVIGAGPCGLRLAIECALLGCKVVLLEKRDRFSRNNVLHFWPFVIHDLRALGAKTLYPKFCAGSIDHISIRQLQCLLLKIALLLGVEIHENVAFTELVLPEHGENGHLYGWRANVVPEDHYVSDYEFDILFGADGKRNTVPGFRRKEFRGKLAIGITANFINRRTEAEERVQEISGVAYVYNQQFFKDMRQETGIDLENIVYYKDDTHYFVMTAKKQSLLQKGVIKQDSVDVQWLLSQENVDQNALLDFAREAADFATQGALPRLDFALNHSGQPDAAMFDFTSLFSAENSCRYFERLGRRLLVGIVGDSLHEPFWPTGSGCARGFLGVFDAAWMIRQYGGASGEVTIGDVLAERESAYRLLAQTTPENLSKSFQSYTIDPRSRYPRFEPSILPAQVRSLIDTDDPASIEKSLPIYCSSSDYYRSSESISKYRRGSVAGGRDDNHGAQSSYIRHQQLARWYQFVVAPYRVRVDNLTTSFRSGLALLAVLRRYCPDVMASAGIDESFYAGLKASFTSTSNWNEIRSKAFNIIKEQFGLYPPLSFNNKEAMYDYLAQLKEVLDSITPQPLPVTASACRESPLRATSSHQESDQNLEVLRNGRRFHRAQAAPTPPSIYGQETEEQRQERHKKRLQTLQLAEDLFGGGGEERKSQMSPTARYSRHRPQMVEKLGGDRLREVEMMLLGKVPEQKREVKAKKPTIKAHKLNQQEVEEMEVKLRETGMGCLLNHPIEPTLSSKESKVIAVKTQILKERAKEGFKERNVEKYNEFDQKMKDLSKWLEKPNLSSSHGVKNLLEQHEQNIDQIAPPPPKKTNAPPPVLPKTTSPSSPYPGPTHIPPPVSLDDNPKQPQCHFCNQRVYLAEKLNVENLSCHRRCFRCAYCDAPLKLNGYGMERIEYSGYGKHFFCMQHLNLSLPEKVARIKQNKEKQQQSQAAVKSFVQRETVADFQPTKPFASQPSSEDMADAASKFRPSVNHGLEHTENIEASPSAFDSLSNSRDLLSSGIFCSSNTPERAEFEVSLRRRPLGDHAIALESGESISPKLTKAMSNDDIDTESEDLLDEEEMLRHNVGDEAVSGGSASDLREARSDSTEANGHVDEEDVSAKNTDDSESDDLLSDEEKALTDLLDKTGGTLPSLDETMSLIQTLKTKRRAASREDLDTAEEDEDTHRDAADRPVSSSSKQVAVFLGICDRSSPAGKGQSGNKGAMDINSTLYFTPMTTPAVKIADDTCFKTPACPYFEGEQAASTRRRLEMGLAKMRAEVRERARLKSDEELTLAATSRSGARYRSSSLRDQDLARTKSHDVLSPRHGEELGATGGIMDEAEPLKRKTLSDELSVAKSAAARRPSTPLTDEADDIPSIDKSAASPIESKKRSFLTKLLHSFSPPSSIMVIPATPPSSSGATAASESNKETSLLNKVGRKYGPNKRRSRGSLSPQLSFDKNAEEIIIGKETSPLANSVKVKPCVDDMDESDSSRDVDGKDQSDVDRKQHAEQRGAASCIRKDLSLLSCHSQDSLLSADSNVSDRETRRFQRAAAKIVRQAENKRHRQAGEIQRQMEELEVKRQKLNDDGLAAEKQLQGDPKNRGLLEWWLSIVEERDRLNRYETELLMQLREMELENQHNQLQQLFREHCCSSTDKTKSSKQLQEEKDLLEQILGVVTKRDTIVSTLEKHRAEDVEKHDPAATTKKIEELLKKKRYDFRNFTAVFSGRGSGGSGAALPAITADERRYLSALDSVI